MNTFNWTKAIGFGLTVWVVMFAVVTGLASLGIYATVWAQIVSFVIAGLVALGFAVATKPANVSQAFGYGVVWAVIGLVLDFVLTFVLVPAIFSQWGFWVGYAFILCAPWLQFEASHAEELTETRHAH